MNDEERLLAFGTCLVWMFRLQGGAKLYAKDAPQLVEDIQNHPALNALCELHGVEIFAYGQEVHAMQDVTRERRGRFYNSMSVAEQTRVVKLEIDADITFEIGMAELDKIVGVGGRVFTEQSDENISLRQTLELMEKFRCPPAQKSKAPKRNG